MATKLYKSVNPGRLWMGILLLLALLLVACSGATPAESGESGAGEVPAASQAGLVPTMPVARFAQPTTVITPQAAAVTDENTPTPESTASVDLDRGETVYTSRCAECHGPAGDGITGSGNALTETTITFAEFENAIRTGNTGALGAEHIFGPMAISPSGLNALYGYVQSLSE